MTDAQQLWDGCAGEIQSQVSEATWRTWFAGVHPLGTENGTLVLGVPNALVRERLESRFADLLTETILDVAGSEVVVQFDVVPEQGSVEQHLPVLAPTPEIRKQFTRSVPLQRFATKDEIADLALFLCSDAANFITGAVVVCDGGQSLAGLGVSMMAALRPRA